MQSVRREEAPPARSARRSRHQLITLAGALALVASSPVQGEAACPWVVQPHPLSVADSGGGSPAYDIFFDGMDGDTGTFYAFSVTSLDLAWKLAERSTLPELGVAARRLEPRESELGTTVYQLDPDSIEPETIYLVAARGPVDRLDRIDARIEPSRPLSISELQMRTRGGSDAAGPLPHRSVPGFLIGAAPAGDAGPDVQICAYEVAMR